MNAYQIARQQGAGAHVGHTNGYVYRISDYSPGTRAAYGWPVDGSGKGAYQRIPEGECVLISD